MKILALTGGIASGKSIVGAMFRDLGAVVIEADPVAHQVYARGKPVYDALVSRYGSRILDAQRNIHRPALAKILFASQKERDWIDGLVHPAVRRHIGQKIQAAIRKRPPLILVEAALHFETGYDRLFEGSILVHTTPRIQRERLQSRNRLSSLEAARRIQSQWPLKKKKKLATWLIENSQDLKVTAQQVKALFRLLSVERTA